MQRCQILVSESQRFSEQAAELLRTAGDVEFADLDFDELCRSVASKDVLWVRLRSFIGDELFQLAPRLKIVATPTTGLTHIDLAAAKQRGIRVVSLRGDVAFLDHVYATAEHTIGLMLALLRNIPAAHAHVLGGDWDRDQFLGSELYGATVGIIGLGRLGRMVAHRLKAFGVRVVACDPKFECREVDGIPLLSMNQVLRQSQGISLHVDLNPSTNQFFGEEQFRQMQDNSWLINTARGEVIDETALLQALTTGKLSGAALDVLANEHAVEMEDRPLVEYARTHSNLLLTPHIGGCTRESMAKTEVHLAKKLCHAITDSVNSEMTLSACK